MNNPFYFDVLLFKTSIGSLNMNDLKCFKAYDIRGVVDEELNEKFAYDLGRAFASEFKPKMVVLGHDIRQSSLMLYEALQNGLLDSGVDVVLLGLCGTEEVNYQVSALACDGGIMVTASHNPMDHNGMKISLSGSAPLGKDTGLWKLKDRMLNDLFDPLTSSGKTRDYFNKDDYIQHLLEFIDIENIKPLRIVANPGNGCASLAVDLLEKHLPIEWIKINYEPDGDFPNGIPNPLLRENRDSTSQAVIDHKADFGLAWDGDNDRCFFFDHEGQFIDGYYLMGLIAQQMLLKHPGSTIVADPRLMWNTEKIAQEHNGHVVVSKGGHSCMKHTMRIVDAVYGGELTAHHYFRDFAYCDSGMIPWLLIAELISTTDKPLQEWVKDSIEAYPCSDELNFKVTDTNEVLHYLSNYFVEEYPMKDTLDGLTLSFPTWRFNVRASNTEPLLRLNIETKGDRGLLIEKQALLEQLISLYVKP